MLVKILIILLVLVIILGNIEYYLRCNRIKKEKIRVEQCKKKLELKKQEEERKRIKELEDKKKEEEAKRKQKELEDKIKEEEKIIKDYRSRIPKINYSYKINEEIGFIHSFARCRNCKHAIMFDDTSKDRKYHRLFCKRKKQVGAENKDCIVYGNNCCEGFE